LPKEEVTTMHINIEFKAKASNLAALQEKLQQLKPRFVGIDHQIDTYFNTKEGRLKLREGNIGNSLIWYSRQNTTGAKQSDVILYNHNPQPSVKQILSLSNGVKKIVDKKRAIYFVDNVKLHFDTVDKLGTFIEVEAIDTDGTFTKEKLQEQCNFFIAFFEIAANDFIEVSYSDML
jgi:adenylate cyclase, class 2